MASAQGTTHIDCETRNAFNELLVMEQLSRMPVAGVLRVLKTIPVQVIAAALAERRG